MLGKYLVIFLKKVKMIFSEIFGYFPKYVFEAKDSKPPGNEALGVGQRIATIVLKQKP